LSFTGNISGLKEKENFSRLLNSLRKKDWVVYSKKPFSGPETVLEYLSRYTHRVAISNNRITGIDDETISFRYRDRAHGNKQKIRTLPHHEFIHRFFYHVLPPRYMRIRHFGFLYPRGKKERLQNIRDQLGKSSQPQPDEKPSVSELMLSLTGIDITLCPSCKKGRMQVISVIEKQPVITSKYQHRPRPEDTS